MEKTLASKQEEFMELYNKSHSRLSRYVQSVVYNKDDVKDIISETLLRVYEKFEKIEKKESFVYYLFKTASRLITDLHKKQNRFTGYDEDILQLPSQEINTAQSFEVKELYKALSRLSLPIREAIVLFEIEGFSQEEICEIQGGTISGVKSRINRGRESLKKILLNTEKTLISNTKA